MKKNFCLAIIFCGILLHCITVFAQPAAQQDTSAVSSKAVDMFYHAVNENAHLYNGTEYIMYDQHIKGDPYFLPKVNNGDIYYDGTLYHNVPMLYELTTGNVVIRQYNGGVLISLINEKLAWFNIFNHTFIHLVPDSGITAITNGYYDRIYNGKVGVYVKRQKILFEDPTTYEKSFRINDRYYIRSNDTWHPVSGQGDVLNVFKDKKKEIAKYLRQNKIKYKRDPELAMVKMAEYYDTITH